MQSSTTKLDLLNTAITSENKLADRIVGEMQLLRKKIKVLSQRISGNNLYNAYKHCFNYIHGPILGKILYTKLVSIFANPFRRAFWRNCAQLTVNSKSVLEFINHIINIYIYIYIYIYTHRR
jgi:hypothetical protein